METKAILEPLQSDLKTCQAEKATLTKEKFDLSAKLNIASNELEKEKKDRAIADQAMQKMAEQHRAEIQALQAELQSSKQECEKGHSHTQMVNMRMQQYLSEIHTHQLAKEQMDTKVRAVESELAQYKDRFAAA